MTFFNDERFCTVDTDSVLNDCCMALNCPFGNFYPNKNFGSLLAKYNELGEVLSAARLAVCNMDGVFIKGIEQDWKKTELIIMINDDERRVPITLEKNI